MSLTLLLFDLGGSPAAEVDSTTTHTDQDGAVFRAPVLTCLTADDSWRMADLEAAQAGTRDRHEQRFVRAGQGITDADASRVVVRSSRAGEPFALAQVLVEASGAGELPDKAAVTTERTDQDGATLAPPVLVALTASESRKGASLEGADTLAQGLPRVRSLRSGRGTTEGRSLRVVVHSHRAGRPFGLVALLAHVSPGSDQLTRAAST